jgi:phosphoribosylformimino-5-aminoimidazole carboxamide ribotide isomerase
MRNLLVIPSIDIKDGKTVRVVQGIPELDCKEYGSDPVEMALIWRAENAKMLHIVDFDGAFEHSHKNFKTVEKICSSVVIPVQFAGGIRNMQDADLIMDTGICRLSISTMALENPDEFEKVFEKYGPSKIAVSVDVVDNEVVTRARKKKSGLHYADFSMRMQALGVQRLIVTDVQRNGILSGPNVELSKDIALRTGCKVTHAGGLRNKDELIDIQKLMDTGIDSVIVGRALYENRFPCQKLWRVAEAGIFR